MRGRVLVAVGLLGAGCTYPVLLRSEPPGALVTVVRTGEVVSTPTVVRLRFPERVEIRADGYRPFDARLRRREVSWLRQVATPDPAVVARGDIEIHLVPDHGPSGTWTEQELPR